MVFICCNKDDGNANLPECEANFEFSDYSLAVGNWWEYRVKDYGFSIIEYEEYELTLEIIYAPNLGEWGGFKCLLTTETGITDTIMLYEWPYVYYSNETGNTNFFNNINLRRSFELGDSWGNTMDTSFVEFCWPNKMVEGELYDTYKTKRNAIGPNYSLNQSIAVAKNVGIVEFEETVFKLGPASNLKMTLLDYHTE